MQNITCAASLALSGTNLGIRRCRASGTSICRSCRRSYAACSNRRRSRFPNAATSCLKASKLTTGSPSSSALPIPINCAASNITAAATSASTPGRFLTSRHDRLSPARLRSAVTV